LASFKTLFLLCLALNPRFTLGISYSLCFYFAGSARGDVSSRFTEFGTRFVQGRHGNGFTGLPPFPVSQLQVWYQFGDIFGIHGGNEGALTQIALSLACLGGEYVTGEAVASLDFAGAGFLETLGRTPVGLNLGHFLLLLLLLFK
jgi:hypothetical protein